MKPRLPKIQNTLLIASGALLIFVGITIIVSPTDFYGANGINAGASISLLNELKAPAGLLLAAGIFLITSIFVRSRSEVALLLPALIFLSYAVSRLMSMAFDGMPASGLVVATALEAGLGLACLVLWFINILPERRVA